MTHTFTVLTLLSSFVLVSCSSSKVGTTKIIAKAESKEIYLNARGDSNILVLNLKEYLRKNGYNVVTSLEDKTKDVLEKEGNVTTVYKNTTTSQNRYLLVFDFSTINNQTYFNNINAVVKDRQSGDILGLYEWKWDHMFPAPKIDEGFEILSDKLLKPIFN